LRVRLVCFFLILAFASGTDADQATAHTKAPQLDYRVTDSFPHDRAAFTQGLLYHQGFLYESTGLYGKSALRKVEISSGKTLMRQKLGNTYFGEGLALQGNQLVQLTWREKTAFIYHLDNLEEIGRFRYGGEGWGLVFDGSHFILSDGSSLLRFLEPGTFSEIRRLRVTDNGRDVEKLNELEIVEDKLFANILGSDRIARIDLDTGTVDGWLDLSPLRGKGLSWRKAADLNGIAYDAATRRVFVTGKRWPWLFELMLE